MASNSTSSWQKRFFRAWVAVHKSNPTFSAVVDGFLLVFVFGGTAILWQASSETYSHYQFNHLPPAEHLRLAQEICRSKQLKTVCADPYTATPHLNKIPRDAAEYNEAQKLLGVIQSQAQVAAERERQTMAAREAERTRLENQTQQESLEQMQRNIAGTVHDSYKCATSTVGTAIVSFDNGHY